MFCRQLPYAEGPDQGVTHQAMTNCPAARMEQTVPLAGPR